VNVLLVEDDRALRGALRTLVERSGQNVLEADSIGQALAQVPEADVVCLDLKLGKESGGDFLKRLRRAGYWMPVVVVSGHRPEREEMESLLEEGIVDFVEKPFSADDFVGRIAKAARHAGEQQQVSGAADRIKAAAQKLKKMAAASITELGKIV
jgi:DNA-binding response OmpR family regulator